MNASVQPLGSAALIQYGIGCDHAGRYEEAASVLQRAVSSMVHADEPEPFFFDALRYLVHSLAGLGRHDEAERALADLPEPVTQNARQGRALVHCGLAADLTYFGENARAIRQYRGALALWSEVGARVNLSALLAATGERAVLTDFVATLAPGPIQPYLLIACMPKSGSSFLKTALCTLTGYPETELAYAYAQSEQELYLPRVVAAASHPSVTQQHCRATEANIQIMQGFEIRPVVLVRNMFDIVASLLDFYDGGAVDNTFFMPFWHELQPAERADLVIDHALPWYFAFYASWVAAERAGRLELMWMSYEEMVADKTGSLSRIAGFYGLPVEPGRIRAAIAAAEGDRVRSRFNKGVAGRGSTILDDGQKARIAQLASRYRGVDYSRVGL